MMIEKAFRVLLTVAIFALIFAVNAENMSGVNVPVYGYKIINIFPHDKESFTEGLIYDKGILYESTGQYGKSTLNKVDIKTGKILEQIRLPDSFFGEGITIWKDRIIQLTWQSGTGLVYNKENLNSIESFNYETEGWGITTDGEHLIMSDGTDTLHFLNPDTFEVAGQINVKYNGEPVIDLNELEFIKGMIYANVWPTDRIAIISPENGDVKAWIDLRGLLSVKDRKDTDVLNGIAYDPDGDRLFVTGKLWPSLFEIKIADRSNSSTF